MTNQHPTTPPPELVRQWCEQLFGCPDEPEINAYELARLAAQWGAQQELEACVKWLIVQNTRSAKWFDSRHDACALASDLRSACTPK